MSTHCDAASTGAELILGTAQLGMPYGIANRDGQPSTTEADAILDAAWGAGVRWLDTARAYGDSEVRIGRHQRRRPPDQRFAIATKFALDPALHGRPPRHSLNKHRIASCRALGRRCIDVLMAHRAPHLNQATVRAALARLSCQGRIGRVGASVQTADELLSVLANPLIGHVQLPFNMLDDRWLAHRVRRALARRSDVWVHARSVFLQGLLLLDDPGRWPRLPGIDPPAIVQAIDLLVAELGRRDRHDLCLAYVRAQPWIHGVVVGAETADQVVEAADAFRRAPLTPEQAAEVSRRFRRLPTSLVNPAKWRF